MPCRDDWSTGVDENAIRSRVEREYEHDSNMAQRLCAVMRALENTGNLPFLYGALEPKLQREIERWWVDHKKRDDEKLRLAEEERRRKRVRAEALSKLTDEERRELGLPEGKHSKFE